MMILTQGNKMGVTPAVNPRRRFAATFPLSQCALLDKLGGMLTVEIQWYIPD